MSKYVLGIDIGTSGTKTVLFDDKFNAVTSCTVEYPMYQPANGYAEQDPLDWWNAVKTTISEVITKSKVDATNIVSVGLSGQMHGLVMLDCNGEVIRNSIIWCDQRTTLECEEITNKIGAKRLIEITANPALTGFTASKILWVKNNEPDNYNKCKHILLPKDYIRYKLTGEFATEVSDASGMQLLDVKNRCWSTEVTQKLGIDINLLAKVYESEQVTGTTTIQCKQDTLLEVGTIVVGGAGDNAAAAVGVGVVKDGRAFTTIGTSGVVYAHTSQMIFDELGRVHTFCSAVNGQWHVMGVTQSAGLSLSWFRKNYCNTLSYNEMMSLASEVNIGADNLIYLPYLMGERTPHLDANCRGVLFGLSAIHEPKHQIRAIVEGVSYSLNDCKNILTNMEVSFDEMVLCGGGAKSSYWRQMLSDIMHIKTSTIIQEEGACLGVAILAAVGAGLETSVVTACDKYITKTNEVNPIERNSKEYNKIYELYKKLYFDLKKSFELLQELGK